MPENEGLSLILDRRSIRKYREGKIERDLLCQMVEAGMYAPSAHNQQPWQFIVMDDPAVFRRIAAFHPYSRMVGQAAAVILCCGDKRGMKSELFWPQDLSAATENILLAAQALGIGAVWLGVYPKEELIAPLRELCGLPETVVPFSLVACGWPEETPARPRRYREDRVHFHRWEERP